MKKEAVDIMPWKLTHDLSNIMSIISGSITKFERQPDLHSAKYAKEGIKGTFFMSPLPEFKLIFLFITVIILVGCSSVSEKNAWSDLKDTEAKYQSVKKAKQNELPNLEAKPDLGNFLAYASLKNAGMEAAFNNWKAALEKITQVRTLPDPRFTYGYFIQEVETKVGPQQNRFSLSQTFPWFGTLMLKGEAAFQNAEAKRQRYEGEKLSVFHRVKEVYYEYYFLGRSIDIIKENLSLFKELEKVLAEKYGTAEFKYSDLIRIQIETVKYAERLDSLNDFQKPLMSKIRYVLNWDQAAVQKDLPYPKSLHIKTVKKTKFNYYRKSIIDNPRLKEIEHNIEREEINRQIAWRRYIPDVTLGVDYIQTGTSSMQVNDNGKDPIIAMISVNLPIYFTKYEAERREAIAKKMAFKWKKVDTKKLLLSNLEKDLFIMTDSKRKMLVYRNNLIPKAKKSLHAIKDLYMGADASYLDLIDAQKRLIDFKLIYEESLVKYLKAIARIEELIGKEIGGS